VAGTNARRAPLISEGLRRMARRKKSDVFPAQTRKPTGKTVEAITHAADTRRNIPTAELQAVVAETHAAPVRVAYERRNRDLDPQLVWRGKDEQDWSDLIVPAPPLYIQEKVLPKALIDDLLKESAA
jgi:adenine-specific DNA-methyltransferase